MCVAVSFMLASAVVQATEGYSVGECPSEGEPQNGVLLLQARLQMNLNEGGAKPECILHVGPHKTGTTSLQTLLARKAAMLQSDGWNQPPDLPAGHFSKSHGRSLAKNMADVALFLQEGSPNMEEPVWRGFVSWVQARARNRENIVLSSEEFDRESVNISLLASVLTEFKTTVVIGYRPFLEWVPSVHRQISGKNDGVDVLSRWLTPDMATTMGTIGADGYQICGTWCGIVGGPLFTDSLVRLYALHFKSIRVLELNEAFLNTFVCSFLSANRTCASLSNKPDKMMNVRAPATVDACTPQGECLDRDVRTVLLDRTFSSATEVASLSPTPLEVNKTKLEQKLDALGLCFC